MSKYVNAYKIVAEIFTDVLGDDYIFCKCVGDTFEFLTDWYEG